MIHGILPVFYHYEKNSPPTQDSKTQNLLHFSQLEVYECWGMLTLKTDPQLFRAFLLGSSGD